MLFSQLYSFTTLSISPLCFPVVIVSPIFQVEGIVGATEKEVGRRLSILSDANIASVAMAPFNENERGRRRSSVPTHDFVLRPLPDESEDDEEVDDVWHGSLHEIKA